MWSPEGGVKLPQNLYSWPPYWLELFKERAAIMQFEGEMTQRQAEREAEADLRKLATREAS